MTYVPRTNAMGTRRIPLDCDYYDDGGYKTMLSKHWATLVVRTRDAVAASEALQSLLGDGDYRWDDFKTTPVWQEVLAIERARDVAIYYATRLLE